MNDSFASAEECQSKIKNILYNQIQTENTNHWQSEEFDFNLDRSNNQSLNQSRGSVSFDTDLPIQSKIVEPIFEVQQVLEAPAEIFQPKVQKPLSELKSQQPADQLSQGSSIPSQVTITLHQESIASKIYQQIDTDDASSFSTSLKSFLSLNDKNYNPHVKCLKFLFSKLKEFSRKSLENLKNYITFMEVKIRQEIQSLRFLDSLEESNKEDADGEGLNMDQKVILMQIKMQGISNREKRKHFYKSIKQYYQRLLQCWRKIKQRREKRERYIDEQIIRVIDRIELEMEDMIICRLQNEREHLDDKYISQRIRSPNPYLSKDKYLEMKYLIQRQNAYLKLITDFNGKLITYMISMFSKEEIQISKTIKQALIDYATSYMECYDPSNHILNIKIDNLDDSKCQDGVKDQLTNQLLTMIPIQLYNITERKKEIHCSEQDKLQALLGDFSNSLQNTIFLSTIQINNDFILFRNQAVWNTSSSLLQKQENGILYQSKAQSKFQTKQALASSRPAINIPDTLAEKKMKVVVVLTSNYYLHLEHEDKIATLRLGDVKLSKRGRQVIISSKEKGFGGYFGFKRELGVLEFQSISEVQIFAQKLSRALSKIS